MRVLDEIKDCVVFVCFKDMDNEMKLCGTAFILGTSIEGTDQSFVDVVTAKHVIEGISEYSIDQTVYLRLNNNTGGIVYADAPIDKWISDTSSASFVDIAILHWLPPKDIVNYRIIPDKMIVNEQVISENEIGVGDEVFITGLFTNHAGGVRNTPIVRVGNVALMPEELIPTKKYGPTEAYLIESRSIGGLSGSPVFVVAGGVRTIKGNTSLVANKFYLLGVIHGHWDQPMLVPDTMLEDSYTGESVNMGIAIVTPAKKILEILQSSEVGPDRIKAAERIRSELVSKQDAPNLASNDDNGK